MLGPFFGTDWLAGKGLMRFFLCNLCCFCHNTNLIICIQNQKCCIHYYYPFFSGLSLLKQSTQTHKHVLIELLTLTSCIIILRFGKVPKYEWFSGTRVCYLLKRHTFLAMKSSLQEVLDMPKANQDLSLFFGVSILTTIWNLDLGFLNPLYTLTEATQAHF